MKKITFIILLLVLALLLTGCARYPKTADDGTLWSKDWEMIGQVLGVEAPGHDLTLLGNATILVQDDTWFATWTIGTPTKYRNADGKETDLYPAQMYVLLFGCESPEQAPAAVAEWMEREAGTFAISNTYSETINTVDYTVTEYTCGSDTNPYSRGTSAFGTYGKYAIAAEFTCTDEYAGDEKAVLADFLKGCHYSSETIRK